MKGKYRGHCDRRSAVCGVALIALLVGSQFEMRFAQAEDSFGGAIGVDELAKIRGGDNDITNSLNEITTASSSQQTTATNENNTIGGDAPAGHVFVQPGSFRSEERRVGKECRL